MQRLVSAGLGLAKALPIWITELEALGGRYASLGGWLRSAPASHREHRRTATAPMKCGEMGLTGAEVERSAVSWTAIEPMEHRDGTATEPGARFSFHISTEGTKKSAASPSPPCAVHAWVMPSSVAALVKLPCNSPTARPVTQEAHLCLNRPPRPRKTTSSLVRGQKPPYRPKKVSARLTRWNP